MSESEWQESQAARVSVPMLFGFCGDSGSGKTKSALRMAAGFQSVMGGDIWVIDSEARRALHYAPKVGESPNPPATYAFKHLPFGPPFHPLRYLAAIEYAISKGAKHIVIDSCSHEHNGVGGVLEMVETYLNRVCGNDHAKRQKHKMAAWIEPKGKRDRVIQRLVTLDANFFLCFRAREKTKPVSGGNPIALGYVPLAGKEWISELVLKFLFYPGKAQRGIPVLQSQHDAERSIIKVPVEFQHIVQPGVQVSEDMGRAFAEWSGGTSRKAAMPLAERARALLAAYGACAIQETLDALDAERAALWDQLNAAAKSALKTAAADAVKRVATPYELPAPDTSTAEDAREGME